MGGGYPSPRIGGISASCVGMGSDGRAIVVRICFDATLCSRFLVPAFGSLGTGPMDGVALCTTWFGCFG